MRDLLDAIRQWRAGGERMALATVIKVDGSAPRDEGASMLIAMSGKLAGSVSGGCVEGAVVDEAQSVLAGAGPKIVRYGINKTMMWDVGLSCGGAIEVFIESLPADAPLPDPEHASALCTVVRGPSGIGCKRIVEPGASSRGSSGDASLDARMDDLGRAAIQRGAAGTAAAGAHEVFVEPVRPAPRLVIVGAVHIAVALCRMASDAGFDVIVVDPRERLNNRERFPAARRLVIGWPDEELPALRVDDSTYVAVLTHDEKFDDPTLDHVLRSPVRYVGAIGSRKTQAQRRARLEAAGFSPSVIDAVHGPIGLDIGAQSPEEIAVAILAEMIAAKHDRSGMKLKDRDAARIH